VITVRIAATGATQAAAEDAAGQTAAEVRRRLGELVFGEGEDTLASVVGASLKAAGRTLAVAESCTGGMLGKMLTDVPGASEYFLGGVVAYADGAKTALLGVPADVIAAHGAVSEPVARRLAEGARERFGADYGLGITGIAGPAGGSAEKPVGLVYIGLAGPDAAVVHRHVFGGDRHIIRRRCPEPPPTGAGGGRLSPARRRTELRASAACPGCRRFLPRASAAFGSGLPCRRGWRTIQAAVRQPRHEPAEDLWRGHVRGRQR
jgi:PncC family amidohydrolase